MLVCHLTEKTPEKITVIYIEMKTLGRFRKLHLNRSLSVLIKHKCNQQNLFVTVNSFAHEVHVYNGRMIRICDIIKPLFRSFN